MVCNLHRNSSFFCQMNSWIRCTYSSCELGHVLFFVVMAAVSVANIVKTSLGPVGLDKMLVDDVGVCYKCDVFISHHCTGMCGELFSSFLFTFLLNSSTSSTTGCYSY